MRIMLKSLCSTLLLAIALGVGVASAGETVEAPASCKHCRMDRTMFSHSRMLVTYADGSSAGTCSLNCVTTEKKQAKSKEIISLQVADYNTKQLIDARTAAWVVGGSKRGVMTAVAKWAFARKQDASNFVRQNGGKLATFKEVSELSVKEPQQQ